MTTQQVLGFWARAVPDGTGCFIWSGYKTPRGYGWVRLAGRNLRAHRAAYEIAIGPIPEGLCIDHLCCNPSCVNPLHLEAVTWWTNTLRGKASPIAKRALATHCPSGHPYTDANLITGDGYRRCAECRRAKSRRQVQRRSHLRKIKRTLPPPPERP